MVAQSIVEAWLSELKDAWCNKEPERAVQLFSETEQYFERPFKPGTTQADYQGYWKDIVTLSDISFDYDIVAIDGDKACVHWDNKFTVPAKEQRYHLDGMFVIEFNDRGKCRVFRQWWFME